MVKHVRLYGGALETVLPEGFLDASLLREVPDTQEIYVNSRQEGEKFDDGLGTNESVIIDLLERVDDADDFKALEAHLDDITTLNGSSDLSLVKQEKISPSGQSCIAMESVGKWGKQELRNTVIICVGLIRLKEFQTDVVISINVPLEPAMQTELELLSKKELPKRVQAAYALLKTMILEFTVVDSSLFV